MRCVERKNHGTLAGELPNFWNSSGVDLVSPGWGERVCSPPFRQQTVPHWVQFHRVAYGGGNLLRCTVLCCTALGKVTPAPCSGMYRGLPDQK